MRCVGNLFMAIGLVLGANSHAAWKNFRGDSQNSGIVKQKLRTFTTGLDRIKTFETTGLIWATAVTDEKGNVYVGSADKYLYALNPNGELRWKYKVFDNADALIDSAALVTSGNKLIIPGGDGYLHAVDRTTGKKVWTFKADGVDDDNHSSGVIVNSFEGNVTEGPNGIIYAGSDNGYMYAVTQEGKLAWKFKTNMMIWSSPAFDPMGKWMIFGSLDRRVYLLDPNTGKKFDEVNIRAEVKASPLVRTEGKAKAVYFGDANGKLYKYEVKKSKSGFKLKRKWKFKTKKEIYSSATSFENQILVGSRNGVFYSVDANKGKLNWSFDTLSVLASSPVVTEDGVVIFGARNGKIYALDVKTGERIWSYKTAPSNIKVNLDASPIVASNGVIYNGSYSGKFYGVPYDYCLNNTDKACEYGGKVDLLSYIESLEDGIYFFYQDREGILHRDVPKSLGPYELMRLKLIVKEKGRYIKNAALWPWGLKVETDENFDVKISSDGHFLNLRPKVALTAGSQVKINISGRYYKRTHWLADQFKYFSTKKYQTSFTVKTENLNVSNSVLKLWSDEDLSLGVRNMFLFQPISMETYIPAALDGQYFVIKNVGNYQSGKGFNALVLPAQKTNGVYRVMPWPSKAFLLKGLNQGAAIQITGSFAMSAMGGTIPFTEASFNGTLDRLGGLSNGQMMTLSPCTKLEGNGDSFQFPLSLIDDTCDHKLRLVAVGKFKTDWAKTQESQFELVAEQGQLKVSNRSETAILVTQMTLDDNGVAVKDSLISQKVEVGKAVTVALEKSRKTIVYVNSKRVF